MKICILGKYPPIQGGVSKSVYITSHDLAHLGHKIHIITNGDEVENSYRLTLDDDDIKNKEAIYDNGYVRLHNIENINTPEYSHIPYSAAYETRLFGEGVKVLKDGNFDLIIGWYYLPYGFVASLLAQKFNIPFMLIHAGSDIGRLICHPQLKDSFQHALETADFVVSQKDSAPWEILKNNGVHEEQLFEIEKGRVLPKYFSGKHIPLNLVNQISKGSEWISSMNIAEPLKSNIITANKKMVNDTAPIIAIYGKVGYSKGSYDLIKVLSELAIEGLHFNFCTIPLGRDFVLDNYFNQIFQTPELVERLFVLPPVANWKIPQLLAAFDITCFLERDFDIEFHTPQIPLEILASGSCLVCSKEIVDKMFFREVLADSINLIQIDDPKDICSFKNKLRLLLQNKEYYDIARRGKKTYDFIDKESDFKSSIANTIEKALSTLKNRKKSMSLDIKQILAYRNDFVIDCFLKKYDISREEAEDIFSETLKWLYLCGSTDKFVTHDKPELSIFGGTRIIDEMWHTFILCTKDYFLFCDKYIGKYIHHQPTSMSEQEEFEKNFLLNPEKVENDTHAEFRRLMSYVYDFYGEDTAVKWFDTYLSKYSLTNINSLTKESV